MRLEREAPETGGIAPAGAWKDAEFGLRTVGGVDYWIAGHPIELFLEAGPTFNMTGDSSVDFDAGLGVRFYFAGAKK